MAATNTKTRKSLVKRLDEVATEWKLTPENGSESVRESLWIEMFTIFFKLYDDKYENSEMVLDVFESAIRNFDPSKGVFSHYVNRTFSFRKKTGVDTTVFIGEDEEEHETVVSVTSLDIPIGEDEESPSLVEFLEAQNADIEGEMVTYVTTLYSELISKIVHFNETYIGKADNKQRENWFRLFFTEDMTYTWKMVAAKYGEKLEREAFSAINTDYLDYYMSLLCRSSIQVNKTPLKPYSQVVPASNDKNEETPVPIPADVSLAFLGIGNGKKGRSNRSNFKGKYKELTNLILENSKA